MNICKRVPIRYRKPRNSHHKLKSGIKLFLIILIAVQFLIIRPDRAIGASTPTPNSAASPYGIIEYVMDLSASMARPLPDGETIWDKTRASIATYENYLLSSSLAFSLRTFGYPDLDCEMQVTPNKPIIAPRMGSGLEIVNAMKKIVPNPSTGVGRSGILWAISKAVDDLSAIGAAAGEHRSIIVFTDGKEKLHCQARSAGLAHIIS